jgi:hypothetical protein
MHDPKNYKKIKETSYLTFLISVLKFQNLILLKLIFLN